MGTVTRMMDHPAAVRSGYRHDQLQCRAVELCESLLDLEVEVMECGDEIVVLQVLDPELDDCERFVLAYCYTESDNPDTEGVGQLAGGCACGQDDHSVFLIIGRQSFWEVVRRYREHAATCGLSTPDQPCIPSDQPTPFSGPDFVV